MTMFNEIGTLDFRNYNCIFQVLRTKIILTHQAITKVKVTIKKNYMNIMWPTCKLQYLSCIYTSHSVKVNKTKV